MTGGPSAPWDLTRDLTEVLSSAAGRRVVWAIAGIAQPFRSPFTQDPLVTAFQSGEQNIGLKTLDLVQTHAPAHYILMLQEHLNVPNLSGAAGSEATRRVADPGRNTLDPSDPRNARQAEPVGPDGSDASVPGYDSPDDHGAGLAGRFPLPGRDPDETGGWPGG